MEAALKEVFNVHRNIVRGLRLQLQKAVDENDALLNGHLQSCVCRHIPIAPAEKQLLDAVEDSGKPEQKENENADYSTYVDESTECRNDRRVHPHLRRAKAKECHQSANQTDDGHIKDRGKLPRTRDVDKKAFQNRAKQADVERVNGIPATSESASNRHAAVQTPRRDVDAVEASSHLQPDHSYIPTGRDAGNPGVQADAERKDCSERGVAAKDKSPEANVKLQLTRTNAKRKRYTEDGMGRKGSKVKKDSNAVQGKPAKHLHADIHVPVEETTRPPGNSAPNQTKHTQRNRECRGADIQTLHGDSKGECTAAEIQTLHGDSNRDCTRPDIQRIHDDSKGESTAADIERLLDGSNRERSAADLDDSLSNTLVAAGSSTSKCLAEHTLLETPVKRRFKAPPRGGDTMVVVPETLGMDVSLYEEEHVEESESCSNTQQAPVFPKSDAHKPQEADGTGRLKPREQREGSGPSKNRINSCKGDRVSLLSKDTVSPLSKDTVSPLSKDTVIPLAQSSKVALAKDVISPLPKVRVSPLSERNTDAKSKDVTNPLSGEGVTKCPALAPGLRPPKVRRACSQQRAEAGKTRRSVSGSQSHRTEDDRRGKQKKSELETESQGHRKEDDCRGQQKQLVLKTDSQRRRTEEDRRGKQKKPELETGSKGCRTEEDRWGKQKQPERETGSQGRRKEEDRRGKQKQPEMETGSQGSKTEEDRRGKQKQPERETDSVVFDSIRPRLLSNHVSTSADSGPSLQLVSQCSQQELSPTLFDDGGSLDGDDTMMPTDATCGVERPSTPRGGRVVRGGRPSVDPESPLLLKQSLSDAGVRRHLVTASPCGERRTKGVVRTLAMSDAGANRPLMAASPGVDRTRELESPLLLQMAAPDTGGHPPQGPALPGVDRTRELESPLLLKMSVPDTGGQRPQCPASPGIQRVALSDAGGHQSVHATTPSAQGRNARVACPAVRSDACVDASAGAENATGSSALWVTPARGKRVMKLGSLQAVDSLAADETIDPAFLAAGGEAGWDWSQESFGPQAPQSSQLNASLDPGLRLTQYLQTAPDDHDNLPSDDEGDVTLDPRFQRAHQSSAQQVLSMGTATWGLSQDPSLPPDSHPPPGTPPRNAPPCTAQGKARTAATSLDDSFDKVPDTKKPQSFAYTDVVRKQNERRKLKGFSCQECKEPHYSEIMTAKKPSKSTNAEKCRLWREKLRQDDPARWEAEKKVDRERAKKKRLQPKTPEEVERQKEQNRVRARRYLAKRREERAATLATGDAVPQQKTKPNADRTTQRKTRPNANGDAEERTAAQVREVNRQAAQKCRDKRSTEKRRSVNEKRMARYYRLLKVVQESASTKS